MREEPVLYINGKPYVVREADQPFCNVEYTGGRSAQGHQGATTGQSGGVSFGGLGSSLDTLVLVLCNRTCCLGNCLCPWLLQVLAVLMPCVLTCVCRVDFQDVV
jgi:hypothetical protein